LGSANSAGLMLAPIGILKRRALLWRVAACSPISGFVLRNAQPGPVGLRNPHRCCPLPTLAQGTLVRGQARQERSACGTIGGLEVGQPAGACNGEQSRLAQFAIEKRCKSQLMGHQSRFLPILCSVFLSCREEAR